MKLTYTHKAWYVLCPVYFSEEHGIAARHATLDWWLDVMGVAALAWAFFLDAVGGAYLFHYLGRSSAIDPLWAITEMDTPVELNLEQ